MAIDDKQEGRAGLIRSAFFGLCPRCGDKTLFETISGFSKECSSCKLDYAGYNVGDGPAAFLTMLVSILIIIFAILLDMAVRPPFWVHAIIWIPVTIILITTSLRVIKAMLLITEHRRDAGETGVEDIE